MKFSNVVLIFPKNLVDFRSDNIRITGYNKTKPLKVKNYASVVLGNRRIQTFLHSVINFFLQKSAYIYLCIFMSVYICRFHYTHIHTHTHIYIYMYACARVRARTHAHTHTYIYIYIYIYIYLPIYMYIYCGLNKYIYIYIYIYIYRIWWSNLGQFQTYNSNKINQTRIWWSTLGQSQIYNSNKNNQQRIKLVNKKWRVKLML